MKKKGIWIVLVVILAVAAYLIYLKITDKKDNGGGTIVNPDAPAAISYTIKNTFNSDTSFFTEGLAFYKGELFASSGLEGKSRLRKLDPATGKSIPGFDIALDPSIFG